MSTNKKREIESQYRRFGEVIRAVREGKKLSQTDVAEQLGISRVSLANIESGRQRVMFLEAIELANQLGFSLAALQAEFSENQLDKKVKEQPKKIRDALLSVRNQFRGEEGTK